MNETNFESHLEWVRGLKRTMMFFLVLQVWSHLEWVRGLKLPAQRDIAQMTMSHLEWVRGLKQLVTMRENANLSRTSSGCVD